MLRHIEHYLRRFADISVVLAAVAAALIAGLPILG
jgi:hypothetical protein